jgi:hypothetical protein
VPYQEKLDNVVIALLCIAAGVLVWCGVWPLIEDWKAKQYPSVRMVERIDGKDCYADMLAGFRPLGFLDGHDIQLYTRRADWWPGQCPTGAFVKVSPESIRVGHEEEAARQATKQQYDAIRERARQMVP